jgi:hypothetical protein
MIDYLTKYWEYCIICTIKIESVLCRHLSKPSLTNQNHLLLILLTFFFYTYVKIGAHADLFLHKTRKTLSEMHLWHVLVYSNAEIDFPSLFMEFQLQIRVVSPISLFETPKSNFYHVKGSWSTKLSSVPGCIEEAVLASTTAGTFKIFHHNRIQNLQHSPHHQQTSVIQQLSEYLELFTPIQLYLEDNRDTMEKFTPLKWMTYCVQRLDPGLSDKVT